MPSTELSSFNRDLGSELSSRRDDQSANVGTGDGAMVAALGVLVGNGTIRIGCFGETFKSVYTCVDRRDQKCLYNVSSIIP